MTTLGLVFPGQGSQSIGMLSELAENNAIISDAFNLVSDKLGFDVWHLVQQGPLETLNQTEHTQVAMLTADVAVFKLLQKKSIKTIKMMAGHSLGEYAALVCANAISLADAALLVAKRGELMQKTVPKGRGAMAAIVGLTDTDVQTICLQASSDNEQVTPANFNAIGQVVIAGHTPAVERAMHYAHEMGARLAKMIPVSVPCHCPLLIEAANEFEYYLARAPFIEPDVAVMSNVDLSIYQSAEQIRALLKEQLYKPVRWVETIQYMQSHGVTHVIECGPGKVLSGLIKRIDKSLAVATINDESSLAQALSYF